MYICMKPYCCFIWQTAIRDWLFCAGRWRQWPDWCQYLNSPHLFPFPWGSGLFRSFLTICVAYEISIPNHYSCSARPNTLTKITRYISCSPHHSCTYQNTWAKKMSFWKLTCQLSCHIGLLSSASRSISCCLQDSARWAALSLSSVGGWVASECVNESGVWCTSSKLGWEKWCSYARQADDSFLLLLTHTAVTSHLHEKSNHKAIFLMICHTHTHSHACT